MDKFATYVTVPKIVVFSVTWFGFLQDSGQNELLKSKTKPGDLYEET